MRVASGLFIFLLIGICLASEIDGQDLRRDAKAIPMIKRYQASRLDKGQPAISLSIWLRQVIGKAGEIEWEINDCGEQDGTGRQKDFPICVQASSTTAGIEVTVMIAVGTHKRGIQGKPVVWGVWVGRKGEVSKVFDNLSELAPELNRLKQLKA